MEVCRRSSWLLLLLGVSLLATALQGVQGEAESEGPSESECRPYIEKALKELETGEPGTSGTPETEDSKEDVPTIEITTDDSNHQDGDGDDDKREEGTESTESAETDQNVEDKQSTEQEDTQEDTGSGEDGTTTEDTTETSKEESANEAIEGGAPETESKETGEETADSKELSSERGDDAKSEEVGDDAQESDDDGKQSTENDQDTQENTEEVTGDIQESQEEKSDTPEDDQGESAETAQVSGDEEEQESVENQATGVEIELKPSVEDDQQTSTETDHQVEQTSTEKEESTESDQALDTQASQEDQKDDMKSGESKEKTDDESEEGDKDDKSDAKENESVEDEDKTPSSQEQGSSSKEQDGRSKEAETAGEVDERSAEQDSVARSEAQPGESAEDQADQTKEDESKEGAVSEEESDEDGDSAPEEELSLEIEIPTDLRSRDHVEHLLKLDDEASETEKVFNRVSEITLRELKKLYENAIKPLEVLYKYRDLSNRHFGDSEIFSKPLILFMGPWSGGKSSIINYLLDNEYNETSLKTGAEPSPAYFNILLHGDENEVIDGTQLAADFTFSGLQKFGQGLEERLRGVKLPNNLLEKVNIVEIPGILEVRKQVSRVFPFNDACQWFIDRADIIFLVYDPSKLDVGPETEAILDQLKGREHQTRIILNKADQVKPEELMRVQGALIWNISPLMSSAQPPIMYTTSLWSRPYEPWAPTRLLQAQERAFLRDLRSAVDKRIENKIASARRFAVRVRNHAKMVDCYLTTYYNHKSVFGNRKQVADEIIEHPQDYHIYEGLSTLTNISRYDLPDPDVYRDFFKLNPLYEFQQLSATCTYFRGCPINRLDVAIAYDLPELVGKHKRLVESALADANPTPVPGS